MKTMPDNDAPNPKAGNWTAKLARITAIGVYLLFLVSLIEIGCQIYAHAILYPSFDSIKRNSRHFYQASENPTLGYELRPDFEITLENRRLQINRWGIRDDNDEIPSSGRRIAIIGDSVAFGEGHTQQRTISAILQRLLDESGWNFDVLNFGVPGYSLREIVENFRMKNEKYNIDQIIFLLNANDFTRRNSIYEGADAGLYRMYNRPLLQTPLFIRKAIFRFNKNRSLKLKFTTTTHFYKWLFDANEEHGYRHLSSLADYAAQEGISLIVVLIPVGTAYTASEYALTPEYERLSRFLEGLHVEHLVPVADFGLSPHTYFDDTDHLTDAGNQLMADIISKIPQPDLSNFPK